MEGNAGAEWDGKGKHGRMPIEQFKKLSSCANCGTRGHLHRERAAARKEKGQAAAVVSGAERADDVEEHQAESRPSPMWSLAAGRYSFSG